MVAKTRKQKVRGVTIAGELLSYLYRKKDFSTIVFDRPALYRYLIKELRKSNNKDVLKKRSIQNTLYYLKDNGYISKNRLGGNIRFEITNQGKKFAKHYEIFRSEKIRSKIWDKKWRVVLFDISAIKRQARDALRFMLKRLGFQQMQKSVWIIPYECNREIINLKSLFNLSDDEVRLIVSDDLGDMGRYRKMFKV